MASGVSRRIGVACRSAGVPVDSGGGANGAQIRGEWHRSTCLVALVGSGCSAGRVGARLAMAGRYEPVREPVTARALPHTVAVHGDITDGRDTRRYTLIMPLT